MSEYKDVSTIISIVPVAIREFKPGIYPGQFNIDPCTDPNIPVLHLVQVSFQVVTVSGQRDPMAIATASYTIAEAVVRDYRKSHLGITSNAQPGLAFVPGEITQADVKTKYKDVLKQLQTEQNLWLANHVKLADNDWGKYKNHRVISELAKIGCRALGLEREWLIDSVSVESQVKCRACKTVLDRDAMVCATCRCVQDPVKAEKEGLKFVA